MPFSRGEEVAAMCGVRNRARRFRPDRSLPAHSRHKSITGSKSWRQLWSDWRSN